MTATFLTTDTLSSTLHGSEEFICQYMLGLRFHIPKESKAVIV